MKPDTAKSVSSLVSEALPLQLLIVEDDDTDARMIERVMQRDDPQAAVQRAATLAQARLLLGEVPFEVALVNHELPDGDCFELLAFLREEALRLPVVVLTRYGHEDVAVAAMKAGASDCVRKELDHRHLHLLPSRLHEAVHRHEQARQLEEHARQLEQTKLIETLRSTVATVKHEINNPLAIISGNAQLLLELARFMELDDELIKPIRDIEEASLRIAESLDKLGNLREIITREYVQGEGSLIDLNSG